jgi:hypothetical protein
LFEFTKNENLQYGSELREIRRSPMISDLKNTRKIVDLRRNSVLFFFSSFRSPSPRREKLRWKPGRKSVPATQSYEKNRFDRAKGRIREKKCLLMRERKKGKFQCCALLVSHQKVVHILLDFISPNSHAHSSNPLLRVYLPRYLFWKQLFLVVSLRVEVVSGA